MDEQLYRKGMLNKQIADFANNLQTPECIIVADSSEPKSIDEIKLYGVNILPAIKGPGSISTGIAFVQGQRISVTARSVNLIKEYRNYMWTIDKNGRILNEPEGGLDHGLDAVRYALNSILSPDNYQSTATVTYHDL